MERRPLRIALTASFPRDIGTYWRAYHMGLELAHRGHRVTLFCISDKSRWRVRREWSDGLELVECPNFLNRPLISHGMGPLDIATRLKALWSEPFDVVHGFEYYADVTLPVVLAKLRRRFVYVSDWCDWFSQAAEFGRLLRFKPVANLVGLLEDWARIPAHGVTVISRSLEQHAHDLGFSEPNVLYLPGGAPVDTVRPLPKDEARSRLGMDPAWKVVGYLASTHAPGMERFAGPLAAVSREIPELRLLLIGHMDKTLERDLRERGLGERIILPGFVSQEELPLYLAASDVFLVGLTQNAYNEARWPSKLGEYLAAGRPVIGSDVGDTRQVIADGKAGYVVGEDPSDIRDKLSLILSDASLADRLGQNARRVAEERLAWPLLAAGLEDFYRKLLSSQHSQSTNGNA